MPTGFPDYQAFEIPVLVVSGGTGATSFTSNGVIIGKGSSPLVATAAGAADQVLRVPGAGGAPAFGAIDLAKAAAVTGTLAVSNGGWGTTSGSFTSPGSITLNCTGAAAGISLVPGAGGVTSSVLPLILGGTASKQVSGGPEFLGFQSATANQVCIANFVGAEANARFLLDLQGNHEWGMGGAADQTTLLAISATGRMAFSGTSGGGLNIVRWTSPGVLEAQPRIALENNGDGIFFTDGTAVADCQIKRVAAQQMDFLGIGAAPTLGIAQSTDLFPRLSFVGSDPSIKFGPGSIAPVDLLIRAQAGQVNFQGVVGFGVVLSGDTNPRVLLDTTNTRISFGPGNAVVDAFLTYATGGLTLAAGGTSQNITLKPSGTGVTLAQTTVAKATTATTDAIRASSSDAANALQLVIQINSNVTAASRYTTLQSVEQGVAFRDLVLNLSGGKVGIGGLPANVSSLLTLTSTTGALIITRMTTAQRDLLTAANGMMIYNTTLALFQVYEAGAWRTM